MKTHLLIAAAAVAFGVPAQAAVVFTDTFDSEAGGGSSLNYAGYANFDVTDGTVDQIKSGAYSINCAGGSGGCVDMDGSTGNSGIMTSKASFAFNAGDTVTLSFSISGNQRGGASDSFEARFDFGSPVAFQSYGYSVNGVPAIFGPASGVSAYLFSDGVIAPNEPFSDITMFFTAVGAESLTFSFSTGSNDNVGPILDNVSLDIAAPGAAVPEPATWAMMIGGFALAGAAMRRRQTAVRFA
jgi:hypothetical protein